MSTITFGGKVQGGEKLAAKLLVHWPRRPRAHPGGE